VRGFSAWQFKFLLYSAKFVSEGHYFPNNYRIFMKLSENIHYTLKVLEIDFISRVQP
jgi:hypothetical protein